MKVKATYVSVWDGGTEVRTNCVVDTETRKVEAVDIGEEGDVLDREYVVIGEEEFAVFHASERDNYNGEEQQKMFFWE